MLFILGIWIINVPFTCEFYVWVLLDCQLFLKISASPEDEITLISKCFGNILVAVTMEIVHKSCQRCCAGCVLFQNVGIHIPNLTVSTYNTTVRILGFLEVANFSIKCKMSDSDLRQE